MYERIIFPIESSHVAYSWIFLRWLPMAVDVIFCIGGGINSMKHFKDKNIIAIIIFLVECYAFILIDVAISIVI